MSDRDQQRWRKLCERAVSEHNPERLCKIIQDRNQLIEEKKITLKSNSPESLKS
ncbi:MAG: hypothetical protein WB869_18535 [Candidatus Acidiferrales bacterium]